MCASWQVSTTSVQACIKVCTQGMRKKYQKPSSVPSTARKGLPTPQVTSRALRIHSDPHDGDGTLLDNAPPLKNSAHGKFMNNITWMLSDHSFSSHAQQNPLGSFTWARMQSGTPVLISKFQGFNQKQYDGVSFTDYIDIKDRLEGDKYQTTWNKCVTPFCHHTIGWTNPTF